MNFRLLTSRLVMDICVVLNCCLLQPQKEVNMISVFQTGMVLLMVCNPFSSLAFEYHRALLGEVNAVPTLCGHGLFYSLRYSLVSCIFQFPEPGFQLSLHMKAWNRSMSLPLTCSSSSPFLSLFSLSSPLSSLLPPTEVVGNEQPVFYKIDSQKLSQSSLSHSG